MPEFVRLKTFSRASPGRVDGVDSIADSGNARDDLSSPTPALDLLLANAWIGAVGRGAGGITVVTNA